MRAGWRRNVANGRRSSEFRPEMAVGRWVEGVNTQRYSSSINRRYNSALEKRSTVLACYVVGLVCLGNCCFHCRASAKGPSLNSAFRASQPPSVTATGISCTTIRSTRKLKMNATQCHSSRIDYISSTELAITLKVGQELPPSYATVFTLFCSIFGPNYTTKTACYFFMHIPSIFKLPQIMLVRLESLF